MPIHFHPIARLLTRTLRSAPKVDIDEIQAYLQKINQEGGEGTMITVNHYFAPDFHAWWFVILISAVVPAEIHWVVTAGWTNSGWLTGFTHWLFPRGARLLGFTPMPAMPPDPAETEQRAAAVRAVLRFAQPILSTRDWDGSRRRGPTGRSAGQDTPWSRSVLVPAQPILPEHHPRGGVEGKWSHQPEIWQPLPS